MSLRQKLLLLMSLTVAASVAAVAWTVLVRIRHVFEQRDQEETALIVSQFQREFQHRSREVASSVDRLAVSERARNMAFEMVQSGDAWPYLKEAQSMAQLAQLDFLEIVGPDGNVVSSAQWPARFGYPEPAASESNTDSFLKREDLPDGSAALGLFAVRPIKGAEPAVRLIGGTRLDQRFLADLPAAPGMTVGLYAEGAGKDAAPESFNPAGYFETSGAVPDAARFATVIEDARKTGQQTNTILYLTVPREDGINITAIPLKSNSGAVLAVLTVAISRASMVAAEQHIRAIAYAIASAGILIAIAFSLWITARVSQPIEQLAHAAEDVAAGNWDVRVPERGRDEVAVLARSFNHMTSELSTQRERLLQSERVAAWRELARRLAHELKNPLFPLQITVENLVRARSLPADEFNEVFDESTHTLGMEIANLKTIIGRFSDFSKMPKPQTEIISAHALVARVHSLYQAAAEPGLTFTTDVSDEPMLLNIDPELLHRAISNLVLNAMDAMPNGGQLTLSAQPCNNQIEIRVSDTGEGLTPEECERLFTPYYTTKQHGTGLGLAIVQSVIADHGGTISVKSRPANGATFIITLPRAQA
jgi:two-component system nitrogen regulation sensor histidine kinase NtrY